MNNWRNIWRGALIVMHFAPQNTFGQRYTYEMALDDKLRSEVHSDVIYPCLKDTALYLKWQYRSELRGASIDEMVQAFFEGVS